MSYKSAPLPKTATQDLGAGALAFSYTMLKAGLFHWVGVGFDVACSQTVIVSVVTATGAAYAFVFETTVLSSDTTYSYKPTTPIILNKGDTVKVDIDTGGSSVASLEAKIEEVPTWLE